MSGKRLLHPVRPKKGSHPKQTPAAKEDTEGRGPRIYHKLNVRLLLGSSIAVVAAALAMVLWHERQFARNVVVLKQDAGRLASDGQYSKAARLHREYARIVGPNRESLEDLIDLYEEWPDKERRDYLDLVRLYARLLAKDTDGSLIDRRRRFAEHLLTLRSYRRAEDEGKKILEQVPNDPVGLLVIATALLSDQEYEEAANEFEKLVRLTPEDVNSYAQLAKCHLEQRNDTAAANVIDEMVRNNPESARAYYIRYLFRQGSDLDAALSDLAIAFKLAPDEAEVRLAQGSEALRAHRWQEAIEAFAGLVDDEEIGNELLTTAVLGLGNAQYLSGAEDLALATWRAGLERLGGANLQIGIRMGEAMLNSNRTAEALAQIEEVRPQVEAYMSESRRTSETAVVKQMLDWLEGHARRQNGEPRKAIPLLESAARADLGNPEVATNACLMLATLFAERGQWDSVVQYSRRAGVLSPEMVEPRMALGRALIRTGRFDEASEVLGRLESDEQAPRDLWLALASAELDRQTARNPQQRSWNTFDRALRRCRELGLPSSSILLLDASRLLLDGKSDDAIQLLAGGQLLNATAALGELRASVFARLGRAATEVVTGRTDQVAEVLNGGWISRSRVHDAIRFWLATMTAYQTAGDDDQAEQLAQVGLQLFPRSAPFIGAAAASYAERKDFDAAIRVLDTGIAAVGAPERRNLLDLKANIVAATGDIDLRIRALRDLNAEAPDDPAVLFRLCEQLLRSDDEEAVKEPLARLKSVEGADGVNWRVIEALRILALEDRMTLDDLAQADELYAEVIRSRPDWARARVLGATLALYRNDESAAIDGFKSAIELGERDPQVFRKLLTLLSGQGDLRSADAYLAMLRESTVAGPTILPYALEVTTAGRRFEDAERLARSAVEEHPDDSQARIWLGHVLMQAERWNESAAAYAKAVELAPDELAPRIAQLRLEVSRGDLDEAQRLVEALETNAALVNNLLYPPLVFGYAHSLLGQREVAKRHYLDAAERFPDNETVLRAAADWLLSMGMPEAESLIAKLRAMRPDDPTLQRAFALQLGTKGNASDWSRGLEALKNKETIPDLRYQAWLHRKMGGPEHALAAIEAYERIIAQTAATPTDRFHLANLYAARGQIRKAIEQLLLVVQSDDVDPIHLMACIELLIAENRRPGETRTLLAKLERLRPGEIGPALLRARLLAASGKPAEALAVLDTFLAKSSEDDPNHWASALDVANVMRHIPGGEAGAEKIFRRLLTHDPNESLRPYVDFLIAQGRGDDAVELCLNLAEHPETIPSEQALGIAVEVESRTPVGAPTKRKLDAALDGLSTEGSQSIALRQALANRRLFGGSYKKAADAYASILAEAPDDVVALNNIAIAYSRTGRHRLGVEAIDRAIELGGPKTELLDTKGLVQLAAGDVADAIDTFKSVTSDPAAGGAHYLHLAAAYMKENRREEADQAIETAKAKNLPVETFSEDDRRIYREVLRSESK